MRRRSDARASTSTTRSQAMFGESKALLIVPDLSREVCAGILHQLDLDSAEVHYIDNGVLYEQHLMQTKSELLANNKFTTSNVWRCSRKCLARQRGREEGDDQVLSSGLMLRGWGSVPIKVGCTRHQRLQGRRVVCSNTFSETLEYLISKLTMKEASRDNVARR